MPPPICIVHHCVHCLFSINSLFLISTCFVLTTLQMYADYWKRQTFFMFFFDLWAKKFHFLAKSRIFAEPKATSSGYR